VVYIFMKIFDKILIDLHYHYTDFPGGSDGKASAYNVGDLGSIPGSGRSPGEGNRNPLQYSCLENPIDRGAWWAAVHGVAKSRTQLSDFTSLHFFFIIILDYIIISRIQVGGKDTNHFTWLFKVGSGSS